MENEIYFSWKLKIGEGKGGKYLEMKDIFFVEVKKTEKKRRIICKRAVHPLINCKRPFHADDHLQAMAMLTEEICQRNSNHSPYISKLYI